MNRLFLFFQAPLILALVMVGCTSQAPAPASGQPGSVPPAVSQPDPAQPPVPQQAEDPQTAPSVEAPRLDVLRLASSDAGFPSPFTYLRGPGYARMVLIFDTLIWKDASGENIPWLAEEWSSSPDGTVWTFKIREGVRWHDGQTMTVDDVVFTFEYFSENPHFIPVGQFVPTEKVVKVDERTVELHLANPSAPFLRNTAGSIPIIPKHIWKGIDDPKTFLDDRALTGTGPFRLLEYNKAEGSYLYEANEDYWLGPPYVKRLEMIPVGDELLALKTGVIDAAGIEGVSSPTMEELYSSFIQDERFDVISAPGEWNLVLYFNMERGAPFNDKTFRQAVAHALDLQFIVDQVLFGNAMPGLPGTLAPSNPWVNPAVQPYPYDPDKAREMLEEAGNVDRNGDGIRETPDGQSMKYELVYANWYSPRFAELIKRWLEDVGIEINLTLVDRATSDEITSGAKYDMALVGYGGRGADPDTLRVMLSSKSQNRSFTRVYGYQNERFDELSGKQISAVDESVRMQMVYEMQEILAEDVPIIPLYYPDRNHIFAKSALDSWYYTPGGFGAGVPMAWNKHIFITGQETGLQIKGR
jgi:peptide/nickel transport system substrate-binding protein